MTRDLFLTHAMKVTKHTARVFVVVGTRGKMQGRVTLGVSYKAQSVALEGGRHIQTLVYLSCYRQNRTTVLEYAAVDSHSRRPIQVEYDVELLPLKLQTWL